MHRLRLLYTLCSVLSPGFVSSAQSTANFGFRSSVEAITSFGGAIAWLPALSGSRAIPLLSKGHNSLLGSGGFCTRIDPDRFGKAKSELMTDDSWIGGGILSAPAPPSAIP